MSATDYSSHSRIVCKDCANNGNGCKCIECKEVKHLCGLKTNPFPMMTGCRWNSILVCTHFTKKEEGV